MELPDNFSKPQLIETIKWLGENYEWSEGVCLPRCVLYTHYLDFCKTRNYCQVGAATFGKIIRQKFPKLTTRRLGTRGQSKYHYYGIGIKNTSIYYHAVYTGKGLTRFSETKVKKEGTTRKFSLSSKSGTLLPDFPSAKNLKIPKGVTLNGIETFILMYRTHCQRILDAVIGGAIGEVQNLLLHFWQGMPDHLKSVLQSELAHDIIGLCDSILYQVLVDVLIPTSISEIPESINIDILHLVQNVLTWMEAALEETPETIRKQKLEAVKEFTRSLRRHTSFLQLAQVARGILLSQENVSGMSRDLCDLDFEALKLDGYSEDNALPVFMKVFDEFLDLLKKQAPVDAYIEWLDCVLDRYILTEGQGDFTERASKFLMLGAHFTSFIVRDMTLKQSSSFASLHVVHQALQEYILLAIETIRDKTTQKQLQMNITKHMKKAVTLNIKPKFRTASKRPSTEKMLRSSRTFKSGLFPDGEAHGASHSNLSGSYVYHEQKPSRKIRSTLQNKEHCRYNNDLPTPSSHDDREYSQYRVNPGNQGLLTNSFNICNQTERHREWGRYTSFNLHNQVEIYQSRQEPCLQRPFTTANCNTDSYWLPHSRHHSDMEIYNRGLETSRFNYPQDTYGREYLLQQVYDVRSHPAESYQDRSFSFLNTSHHLSSVDFTHQGLTMNPSVSSESHPYY